MGEKRCAVIGSGLGGLAAAIRIAGHGIPVDLYEQGPGTGGKAGEINTGAYRFDTGPSVFTMPFVIEQLFRDAGDDLTRHCTLQPLEQHCRYFFADGTRINAYSETDHFAAEIARNTLDRSDDVYRYLNYAKSIYDLTAQLFLFQDFHEWNDLFNTPGSWKTLLNLRKIDSLRSVHRANASFFKDPRTLQLFDRYATYNGSNPYRAPATLNIIPHVEYNMGSFLVREGIHAIPRALTTLAAERGVRIHLNTKIDGIVTHGAAITGIRVGTDTIPYSIVVSNADVSVTYRDLLQGNSSRSARRYQRLEPSTSALVFYWGVEGSYPNLGIHSIIFSRDYRAEFRDIFDALRCPTDPTVYIYISSRYRAEDAPAGHENWFVMVNAPHDAGQDWNAEVSRIREGILEAIHRRIGVDIRSRIRFEEVTTPPLIERRTSSLHGSLYGISSNSRSAAFLRHRIRSLDYRGLYFCGGSAHPGGGIPLVILSGTIAGDLVKRFDA